MDLNKELLKEHIDNLWENELKKEFSDYINSCLEETKKEIKNHLDKYDNQINNYIQELGQNYKAKLKKFEEIKNKKPNKNKIQNDENNFNDNKILKENNNNNNKIESDEELRKRDINLESLNNPPLINLILPQNANPLVNIILLCLSNIKYFVQYYLDPQKENIILKKSKENPNNNYLGPSFLKLLDHLWKSNKKEYSPYEIHDDLKKLMMNNYNSNNADIILIYILNKLDEELNFNKRDYITKADNPYDYFNKNLMANKLKENFTNNKTIISDYCYSCIEIKKKCIKCNVDPMYNFEATPVINIYLQKEKGNEIFNELSLEEHLNSLLIPKKGEYIKESCVICDDQQKKYILKKVFTTSGILIININRDKDPNNTLSFTYPENFNGEKIISINYKSFNYELRAVINKVKKNNLNNWDYIISYKNFIDNNWYLYNNQNIKSIQKDYKKYIFQPKKACVLIYTKEISNAK